MILEIATLVVRRGREQEYEAAFGRARDIIARMRGFISLELVRCLEIESKYVLLVRWETLADHVEGFRQSPEYQQWRALLHPFYEPTPQVEHYERVAG